MSSEIEHAVVGVYRDAKWVGTAFFITPNILLTAGHVVSDLAPNEAVTIQPSYQAGPSTVAVTTTVTPTAANGFLDYALLRMEDPSVRRRYLAIGDKKHKRGDEFSIAVLGFRPAGHAGPALERMTGAVVGYQDEKPNSKGAWSWTLKLHFEATPGFSGAPLIDHTGKLIGVLVARVADSVGQKRKTIGIPIGRIIRDNQVVERAVQDLQFAPRKHPRKESGQRVQHAPKSPMDLVRVLWTAQPFAVDELGRKTAEAILKRLEQEAETVRGALRVESPNLRNGGRPILWRVEPREISAEDSWATYFGPGSNFPLSDADMPLLRVLVDSQTSLPRASWKDIPLDHDQISHGILVRLDAGSSDSGQCSDHGTVCIGGHGEDAVTEAVARIVDAFLDINLFHRFHHLNEMFPTAAAKARLDGLKQQYIARHPAKIYRPLSIASLARHNWKEPPRGSTLVSLWTEFVQKHVHGGDGGASPESRSSPPSPTAPSLLQAGKQQEDRQVIDATKRVALTKTITDLVSAHGELCSRISSRTIRRAVENFRPATRDKFAIFAIIVDKPDTRHRREELMKLFHLPVWKMQGATARIFEMTERAALNSLARHVAAFIIPTDSEA